MSSDIENIRVEVVKNDVVTIPVEEYSMLIDHDTRLMIIREQVKKSIDNYENYRLCSNEFLLAVLDLLGYKPKEETVQNPEKKDE